MKELIKQYLDQGMSRRQLVSGLSALGMSARCRQGGGAKSRARSDRAPPPTAAASAPAAIREVEGNGGTLFVEQLKAAGVEYIFFNPSTGDHPIFDALVDVPEIKLIKGIQEGAVVAMADGYARASGRTGVVVVANIGLPNAMTQMVNTYKDQIPLLVAVASIDQDALGRDQLQEPDHPELMTEPITKWFWQAQSTAADRRDDAARARNSPRRRRAGRCSCRCRPTRSSSTPRRRCGSAASSTCRCGFVPIRTTSRKRRAC